MRVDLGITGGLLSFGGQTPRLNLRRPEASGPPQADLGRRRALDRLDERLGDLRQALDRLQRTSGGDPIGASARTAASENIARSASALDLEPYATFTTLASTVEVNTLLTSFTPRGPTVSGDTTSLPTVGGVYDGDQGDDVLTFEFRNNATVGTNDKLKVRVRDGEGKTIESLDFRNQPAGTELTLSNGLTVALGAGDVSKGDTFQVQVSTSVGSAVDPTKPFDGTRNDDPNFEPGLSVTAGVFDVNGVSIAVGASDSLDAVLARITASAAGVTATFDAATESVQLIQKQAGSAFDIVLGNDTSGFLAASKLDGAGSVLGQDGVDPIQEPIADVPSLSGITSGTFSVNGVQMAVDVAIDSLGDVLDRINASGAGVRATLDPDTAILTIDPDDSNAVLALSDGTSGLFSALKISPGSYAPVSASAPARIVRSDEFRPLLYDARRALNRLFELDVTPGSQIAELASVHKALRSAIFQGAFGEADPETARLRTGFGITFDLDAEDGRIMDFDSRRLVRSLETSAIDLHDLLFRPAAGADEPGGLVTGLLSAADGLQDSVDFARGRIDPRGRRIDLRA